MTATTTAPNLWALKMLSGPRRSVRHADTPSGVVDLICFAACIEGLFFYGAFAYVYFG